MEKITINNERDYSTDEKIIKYLGMAALIGSFAFTVSFLGFAFVVLPYAIPMITVSLFSILRNYVIAKSSILKIIFIALNISIVFFGFFVFFQGITGQLNFSM